MLASWPRPVAGGASVRMLTLCLRFPVPGSPLPTLDFGLWALDFLLLAPGSFLSSQLPLHLGLQAAHHQIGDEVGDEGDAEHEHSDKEEYPITDAATDHFAQSRSHSTRPRAPRTRPHP